MRSAIGLLLVTALWAATPQSQAPGNSIALAGATVYTSPDAEPLRNAVVLVQDGKVAAVGSRRSVSVPAGVRTIDCTGLTITAGFWNSHVHLFERKWGNAAAVPAPELARQLQEMLTRYGFTSAFDIGSGFDNTQRLRARIESGEVAGPRIRTTGEPLVAPGAVPADAVIRALGYLVTMNPAITDAAGAAAAARRLLDAGADGIKIHLQPPAPPSAPIPDAAIRAAIDEAHRAGRPAFVHPANGADVLRAVNAGAGVIAHTTPASGAWDAATIAAMRTARVAVTPTLTLWKSAFRHDRISTQELAVRTSVEQLRAWAAAGGTVLFGNDLGAVDYDPREEYALMGQAGMTFRQILASLTAAPAEKFGAASSLGRIAPGFTADLTVLEGDPSRHIQSLAAVRYTLRAGTIIYAAPR